ncbi:MAG: hypothetical protein ACRBB0_05860 [Pelagimonas sp.]|uniref:hypothetical protein n=1 Tax=Pelagimonas sp. TaxID=2073170 RepID=UPI003D6BE238
MNTSGPQTGADPPQPLEFRSSGRSLKAALVLLVVWLVLVLLWAKLNAAPWIMVALFLPTLPAAYEFASAKQAWFELTDKMMSWQSGRRSGDIALNKIDHVRLETRLDLSVRVKIQAQGKRIVLPQDCVPPHGQLETALRAREIAVTRHHFGL